MNSNGQFGRKIVQAQCGSTHKCTANRSYSTIGGFLKKIMASWQSSSSQKFPNRSQRASSLLHFTVPVTYPIRTVIPLLKLFRLQGEFLMLGNVQTGKLRGFTVHFNAPDSKCCSCVLLPACQLAHFYINCLENQTGRIHCGTYRSNNAARLFLFFATAFFKGET